MPITRTSNNLITTVANLDTFFPEETYETLSEALATYGRETIVLTDASWVTISNSPTSCGLLKLSSTDVSAIFTLCKNGLANNVSKISSVSNGSVYFSCQWSSTDVEICAVNNSSTISVSVGI